MGDNLLSKRLRNLRRSLGLSQEAMGMQGFVSTPGWVKIENGTRHPSDELIKKIVDWLVRDGYLKPNEKDSMLDEFLTLKYMSHLSPFVRKLARDYHTVKEPNVLKAAEDPTPYGQKR